MQFIVDGIQHPDGAVKQLTIEAESADDAAALVRQQNIFPTKVLRKPDEPREVETNRLPLVNSKRPPEYVPREAGMSKDDIKRQQQQNAAIILLLLIIAGVLAGVISI